MTAKPGRICCLLAIAAIVACLFPTANAWTQEYLNEISTQAEFDSLRHVPLSSQYSAIDSVKIVYWPARDQIFFANSEHYIYHYQFCRDVLNYLGSLEQFNRTIYSEDLSKIFLLGTLSKHPGRDDYVLEISASDQMTLTDIVLLYGKVRFSFHLSDRVSFLTNTTRLESLGLSEYGIATVSSDELYESQVYQALNPGVAYGQLLQADVNDFDSDVVEPHHILLLNGSLLELPPSAAVITDEFQTPLSHMVVLSRNRGSVIVAARNANQNATLLPLVGSWVKLTVDSTGFAISPSTEQEYLDSTNSRAIERITLARDLSETEVLDIDKHDFRSISSIGGKAANFAELASILDSRRSVARVPEGAFAIPFYYYQQHIESHGIDTALADLLDDSTEPNRNQAIRDRIREAPIDAELLRVVTDRVVASGFDRMRFRSSSNAEDLDDFSGAGLYDSVTGVLDSNDRSIERAIKKVWASAWNYEAFTEREYFGIDQNSVAMGILVHRSFPNEIANGVAITRNIYRSDNFPAFVLNVQIGENSVVNPEPGVTADQIISYNGVSDDSSFEGAPEYITYSSLTDGEPILNDQQILALTIELRRIKEHFHLRVRDYRRNYSFEEFALDIEFKYNGDDEQLYIKQARVFR